VIDTRQYEQFSLYPLYLWAINIPYNENFVGVLWSVVLPTDNIIVIIEHMKNKDQIIKSIMSIGYESLIQGCYIHEQTQPTTNDYTIIDLRSPSTFKDNPLFTNSINIPIEELTKTLDTLDKNKNYVTYCWGSYKSCVASTLLRAHGYQSTHVMPQ
jgi:rhodanese-related sulfurtransferase